MSNTRPALSDLVNPSTTAILVIEMQNGIVGEEAGDSPIAAAVAEHDVIGRCATLAAAARKAGARVVHCTKTDRAVGDGGSINTPMWRRRVELGLDPLSPGTPAAAIVEGLTPATGDLVCERTRGVTVFGSTELDPILRNLGIRTVVVSGVSMNVAAIGTTMDAISNGYDVVVAKDAMGGAPDSYVEQVLKFTLAPLAKLATVDDIVGTWT